MIEEYAYSAGEELGGFLVIGLGLGFLALLLFAQGLWTAFNWWRDRKVI